MPDVKWIKIVTNVFDDEKIKYIETLPSGDAIIVIWFKILCLAGKSNSSGLLMMTDRIPYTDEMLASIFDRDIKTIQFSLKTFSKLDMIEIYDNKIYLLNWEKHQNIKGLDKIREQTKNRVAKHRMKKMIECNADVTQDVTQSVTQSNATELELELEEDIDKDKTICRVKKNDIISSVIDYMNSVCKTNFRKTTKTTQSFISARVKEGFTIDDFIKVIDLKYAEWHDDDKMSQFLRPQTLFGTKFEAYLNQKVASPSYKKTIYQDVPEYMTGKKDVDRSNDEEKRKELLARISKERGK